LADVRVLPRGVATEGALERLVNVIEGLVKVEEEVLDPRPDVRELETSRLGVPKRGTVCGGSHCVLARLTSLNPSCICFFLLRSNLLTKFNDLVADLLGFCWVPTEPTFTSEALR
jgi:hypothetical protein